MKNQTQSIGKASRRGGNFFALSITAVFLAASLHAAKNDTPSPTEKITFREELKIPPQDRPILEAFIGHAMKFARERTTEKVKAVCPDTFPWVDFRFLNCLNIAYELTGDTAYLDQLKDTFAIYRDIMTTGGDEYLGWYGSPTPPRVPNDDPSIQVDEIQTSFRAMAVLSKWVELASANKEYAQKNSATIAAYLDLMETHLFPKWDKRGFYVELEKGRGIYRGLDFPAPTGITLSHEKLSIMVDGLLGLYRATGKDIYLQRALRLGAYFKSCLSVKDGHYEWMSWCPAGKWDVSADKPDAWRVSWVAPDPNAEWYVASLSMALNLYQLGLLFNDADLARFVRTQKEMCWNGNTEAPEYRNVAGQINKYVKGRFLSQQLAHYDPVLTKLAFQGPHEAEVQKNTASDWKGGANAQAYVQEKYLMHSRVSANPQPYKQLGEKFLSNPVNKAFYDRLFFEVQEPGAVTPLKPSQAGF